MKLSQLFDCDIDLEIKHLSFDSRDILEDSLFFCIPGFLVDGHDFAQKAIDNGAIALVAQHHLDVDVPVIIVKDTVAEMNRVADLFYHSPSEELFVYGITGTNGKSTIATTLRNLLLRLGKNAAYMGTISVEYNGLRLDGGHTTPEITKLQAFLREMLDAGVSDVALEVSSQGLDLHRVDSVHFKAAVFTNLTHDHLDYHKTMDKYFEAKKILFDSLDEDAIIVLNTDDPYSRRLIAEDYPGRVFTYGIDREADYQASDIQFYSDHTDFILNYKEESYPVRMSYVARFNVYNILAVIAVLHQRGFALEEILPLLVNLEEVEGRQMLIDEGQPFKVYVDYAHSPDGLMHLYTFMRSITPPDKKLLTVLGSQGARDKEKRPEIGKVGSSLTDFVIVTEHDNRNERVVDIAAAIISGMLNDRYGFVFSRYEAIETIIKMAKPGDTVVIAGKGMERFFYHDYGKGKVDKRDWMGDDAACVEILRKYYGGKKDESE